LHILIEVANSIGMCANSLQQLTLHPRLSFGDIYCFYVVTTSILVLAVVCLQKPMWNSGVGFHIPVASFFVYTKVYHVSPFN